MAIEQFVNNAASTLASSITSGATTLTVASAATFPTAGTFRLVIGTEIIIVGAVSGTTFSSLTRGAEGTTAAAHTSGDAVTCILTAGSLVGVAGSINLSGLLSARPAAGVAGRVYYATDTFASYRDNGTTWDTLGSAGGGGGALVLLDSKTAANSASLDFTTAITSAYDEYVVEFINVTPATNGVSCVMRVSSNGGSSWDAGANYNFVQRIQSSTYAAATEQLSATSVYLGGVLSNTASAGGLNGRLRIFNPLSTTAVKWFQSNTAFLASNDSHFYLLDVAGQWNISGTAQNAVQFLMSTGNIASGTIRIYGIAKTASGGGGTAAANTGLCQGRLTTESGVAVSTSDRTAQSTLYFTPYQGNRVALYSGSAWGEYALTERSFVLTGLTSGKNYDVFLYDNAGTLTLELSAAWSSDSARTDALILQDAVWVKSGATTRRYIGTIRTTGTTTTADAANQLFVWNCYNRVSRTLRRTYTTTYTYATNTIREQNGVTTERLEFVRGLNEDGVLLSLATRLENPNAGTASISVGFGFDSTTAFDTETAIAQARLTDFMYMGATLAAVKRPAAGYHYVTMLERTEVNTARSNAGSDRTLMATVIG
jgi:hypothetical protein